jgi:hypothetical protein
MLEALVTSGTASEIPIGERPQGLGRLLRPQKHVEGWELDLPEGEDRILRTDGTLVFAASYPGAPSPTYTSLSEWIDRQIRGARSEFRENGTRDVFNEAFNGNAYQRGSAGSTPEAELRARVDAKADAITQAFADALHERQVQP